MAYHPEAQYRPPPDNANLSSEEAAQKLKAMGSSVDAAAMFRAAQDGDVAAVTLLLKAGIDPNMREEATARRRD